MGVALQCPECGFKHRLDAVGDRSVFPCAQCARELKVPAEYRTGATPAANGSNGAGGTPRARSVAPASARPRPKHQIGAAPMRLPVRILLWVVAFVLGALVVRFLAKVTGFAGGDTFFDLLIDGKLTTYLRLFALVPVWALFATLFATAMIDGPRAWASRRAGHPSAPAVASGATAAARRPKPRPAPSASPAATGAAVATGAAAARSTRSIPRREPAPVAVPGPKAAPAPARMPDPPPVAPVVAKTAAVPAAKERSDDPALDFGARAASGQRPRRIPRRGVGS